MIHKPFIRSNAIHVKRKKATNLWSATDLLNQMISILVFFARFDCFDCSLKKKTMKLSIDWTTQNNNTVSSNESISFPFLLRLSWGHFHFERLIVHFRQFFLLILIFSFIHPDKWHIFCFIQSKICKQRFINRCTKQLNLNSK